MDCAWAIFAGVDMKNGAEVSCIVVLATTHKSQPEVLRLEDSILMADRVRNATDIEKAFVEWDAICREYVEAGGCALSDHRQVGVFMRMPPVRLNEDVLNEFGLMRWI